MALQSLNIGSVANDGSGDTLRAGGDKINDNFSEIYTTLGDGSSLGDSSELARFSRNMSITFSRIIRYVPLKG